LQVKRLLLNDVNQFTATLCPLIRIRLSVCLGGDQSIALPTKWALAKIVWCGKHHVIEIDTADATKDGVWSIYRAQKMLAFNIRANRWDCRLRA
jgi:hypothetical protein